MAGLSGIGTRMRAALAAVALYGLLLQGVLSSLTGPPPILGPDLSAICSPEGGPAAPDGQPASHDSHGCCTAACGAAVTPAPEPGHNPVLWPRRHETNVVWRAADTILPTGPPVLGTSARGPPTA